MMLSIAAMIKLSGCAILGSKVTITEDKLPDNLSFVLTDPVFKGLTLNDDVNPFYINFHSDSNGDSFAILTKDFNDQQVMLLGKDGHLVRKTVRDLGVKGKKQISYFKEASRFPSGAALDHTGGGLVVVLSDSEPIWLYYKKGWQVVKPR